MVGLCSLSLLIVCYGCLSTISSNLHSNVHTGNFDSLRYKHLRLPNRGKISQNYVFTTQSRPYKRSLLKTGWEKEKMLVTSIFSFPHHVFYHFLNKLKIFSHFYFVNAFNMDRSKFCRLVKS